MTSGIIALFGKFGQFPTVEIQFLSSCYFAGKLHSPSDFFGFRSIWEIILHSFGIIVLFGKFGGFPIVVIKF